MVENSLDRHPFAKYVKFYGKLLTFYGKSGLKPRVGKIKVQTILSLAWKTMTLPEQKRSIGVFANRFDAQKAINELKATGFPMDKLSVIGPDTNPEEVEAAANNLGDTENQGDQAARAGTISGGALGGLAGVLTGIAILTIPGLGPVVAGGAAANALATTLAGTAVGATAGGLVGGMSSLAIPELKAQAYKDWLSRGAYLVMVEGSEDDIGGAETILSRGGIQDWFVYK